MCNDNKRSESSVGDKKKGELIALDIAKNLNKLREQCATDEDIFSINLTLDILSKKFTDENVIKNIKALGEMLRLNSNNDDFAKPKAEDKKRVIGVCNYIEEVYLCNLIHGKEEIEMKSAALINNFNNMTHEPEGIEEDRNKIANPVESKTNGMKRGFNVTISRSNIDRSIIGFVGNKENSFQQDDVKTGNGNKECIICNNVIDSSNRLLLCKECGERFCQTCESWFREPRTPGERPLCEACFNTEQEKKLRDEEERSLLKREQEEQEKLHREKEKQDILSQEAARLKTAEEAENKRKAEAEKKWLEGKRLKKQLEKQEQLRRQNEETERKRCEQEEERLRREREETEKKKPATSIKNSIGMELVLIPAGEFMMGSNSEIDEQPVHKVKISKPFYFGKFPATQKEWKAVMGSNPLILRGDDWPVDCVSWNDVQEFVEKLNEMEGTDKYRLPSEAEWEYACRAGTTTKYSFGDDESKLGEYAWYDADTKRKTDPVGLKKPNPWGLYDMHGNVCEWCQDRYHDSYNGAPTDGSAWEDGSSSYRVYRGGYWCDKAKSCRSATRNGIDPDFELLIGFRLLREL